MHCWTTIRKSRNFNNSTLYVHAWCYTGYVLETSISTFFISLKLPSPRLQCAGNFHLHVCYQLETSISAFFFELETSISTFVMSLKLQSPRLHTSYFSTALLEFSILFYMFRINSLYVCLLFRIKYLKKTLVPWYVFFILGYFTSSSARVVGSFN